MVSLRSVDSLIENFEDIKRLVISFSLITPTTLFIPFSQTSIFTELILAILAKIFSIDSVRSIYSGVSY